MFRGIFEFGDSHPNLGIVLTKEPNKFCRKTRGNFIPKLLEEWAKRLLRSFVCLHNGLSRMHIEANLKVDFAILLI
jgi:hypothetical protein